MFPVSRATITEKAEQHENNSENLEMIFFNLDFLIFITNSYSNRRISPLHKSKRVLFSNTAVKCAIYIYIYDKIFIHKK